MNHPSHDDGLLEHCPWRFAGQASDRQRTAQEQRQKRLFAGPGEVRLGEDCFVAESAAVYPDVLHLGDRSYIAAQAYVTGRLRARPAGPPAAGHQPGDHRGRRRVDRLPRGRPRRRHGWLP
ncbi:hypothetical protein GCM10010103_64250 [Streptomyces paradoxus]